MKTYMVFFLFLLLLLLTGCPTEQAQIPVTTTLPSGPPSADSEVLPGEADQSSDENNSVEINTALSDLDYVIPSQRPMLLQAELINHGRSVEPFKEAFLSLPEAWKVVKEVVIMAQGPDVTHQIRRVPVEGALVKIPISVALQPGNTLSIVIVAESSNVVLSEEVKVTPALTRFTREDGTVIDKTVIGNRFSYVPSLLEVELTAIDGPVAGNVDASMFEIAFTSRGGDGYLPSFKVISGMKLQHLSLVHMGSGDLTLPVTCTDCGDTEVRFEPLPDQQWLPQEKTVRFVLNGDVPKVQNVTIQMLPNVVSYEADLGGKKIPSSAVVIKNRSATMVPKAG